jgi:hypothetical protein
LSRPTSFGIRIVACFGGWFIFDQVPRL